MKNKSEIRNNKGFSLIELLVVIAVMTLLLAVAVTSFSIVNNANVSKAAKSMESMVGTARVTSMSKGEVAGTLNIIDVSGSTYAYIGDPALAPSVPLANWTRITTGAIDTEFISSDDDPNAEVGGSELTSAVISFTPAGAVKTCTINGTDQTGEHVTFFFKHGRRGARAYFYRATGKHSMSIYNVY